MKTIKQIADELGIDKQKVYRYIKRNNIEAVHQEAHQKNDAKYYDETAETLIKTAFSESNVHQENTSDANQKHSNDAVSDALIEMLQRELEEKNKQISDLNNRLQEAQMLISQEQQLRLVADKKLLTLENKSENSEEKKKTWWQKLFGR